MAKWFKDFFRGVLAYVEGFKFIFENNLWYYFVFPTIFLLLLVIEEDLLATEVKNICFKGSDVITTEDGKEVINSNKVLIASIKGAGYYIVTNLKHYVVLILSVPILSMLSMATERIMTGNKYPFSFKQLLTDIRRGANIAATNMIIQMLIIAGWYLISLIFPILSPASKYIVFCVGFYFYGFSLMDYTNERRRLNLQESMQFIRQHSGMAIAIGGIFSLIFVIPFYIGWVIAPISGVVAATIAIHKTVNLKKNKFAIKNKGNTPRVTEK